MSYLRSPERQRQILDCAKRVFARLGFHGANVSHICEEAGIGRGTLYLYFENKRAVLVAILEELLSRVRTHMIERRQPQLTPDAAAGLSREQISAWSTKQLARLLDVVFSDQATLRIVLREAVGLDVDIDRLLANVDEALIAIVRGDLERARDSGLVRADLDLNHVATMIVGGVEKLALAALRGETQVNTHDLARSAVEFHMFGTLQRR